LRNINWTLIRAKVKEAVLVLPHFFKNPVQGMRMLPDWEWPEMLILEAAFAAACAFIGNLIARNLLGMITGIVIAPLATLIALGIGAGFFYYTFKFFFQRDIPYRQIFQTLVFASIPLMLVGIISPLIPPIVLLGCVAMMLLLYIGFTDNFHLERPRIKKLLIGLTLLYAVSWAVALVRTTSRHERMRLKATPESLDILEKELNIDNDSGN
jgi:hypothetical protein